MDAKAGVVRIAILHGTCNGWHVHAQMLFCFVAADAQEVSDLGQMVYNDSSQLPVWAMLISHRPKTGYFTMFMNAGLAMDDLVKTARHVATLLGLAPFIGLVPHPTLFVRELLAGLGLHKGPVPPYIVGLQGH